LSEAPATKKDSGNGFALEVEQLGVVRFDVTAQAKMASAVKAKLLSVEKHDLFVSNLDVGPVRATVGEHERAALAFDHGVHSRQP